jgi:hypothetical protein
MFQKNRKNLIDQKFRLSHSYLLILKLHLNLKFLMNRLCLQFHLFLKSLLNHFLLKFLKNR